MLTKDLIKQLQKLVDDHEPYEITMGEHDIVIDVFGVEEIYDQFGVLQSKHYQYKGFSHNIKIEKTDDGVYDIISAFEGGK